ncbi:hypothetical protein llap_10042 [Limosa lapponica baueri]|uniref:Uncharacterized protein n=1 Tax=Limosa lapponica baueri TaxID=1758121 RepID=A0A2I0U0U3_LIMLA|nr:hypothetical protein llap_10042 [Limosa lapponica baueri]
MWLGPFKSCLALAADGLVPVGEDVWDEELSSPASSAVGPKHPGVKELKTKPVTAHQPHQQQGGLADPNTRNAP